MGGFLLYGLGAAAAARMDFTILWAEYFLGQVVVLSIQLMAQYLNEYHDIEVDWLSLDNRTWFSGGSGVLSAGGNSPAAVLAAASICAVVALLTGIPASLLAIWMIPIIIFSLLGSWSYSSPPLSLLSSGWGELTTSIIVALLVPLAGYCMQGGFPPAILCLACFPLVLIHAGMLISFEFPDRALDQSVGKKMLTVRLGLQGAAWVVTALIDFAILFLVVQGLFSKYPGQWLGWTVPLAIWQMVLIHRVIHLPTRTNYYLLTPGVVALFVLMALLTLLGFVFAV